MREFAEDYNKLYNEHTLNKAAIQQFSNAIKELKTDFRTEVKEFKGEIKAEIKDFTDNLKKIADNLIRSSERDSTLKWVIKIIIGGITSGITITIGLITISKYFN